MALIVPETSDMQLVKPEDRYSIQARRDEGLNMFRTPPSYPSGGFFVWQAPSVQNSIASWNYLYPNTRDYQLKYLSLQDTMMASAIYSMKTRMMTLDYQLNGPDQAKAFSQDLLNSPGLGDNLPNLVSKITDDLLSCDNGAFIEKWGPGDPMTPLDRRAVLGFGHLDSRLCYRTFDPEYPVIYTNPQTQTLHKLHASRVVIMSDNPQPFELARGVGFCAISRALKWVQYIRDVVLFRSEKVSGKFTRAIGVARGVTRTTFEEALEAQKRRDGGSGFVMYSGIPFLVAPGMRAGEDIEVMLTDLASLPEGFEFKEDLTLYAFILAMVLGVDAREFWPGTVSGATKGDATVQNQKAQSRGIGAVTQTVEWGLNQCLPEEATLTYDTTDEEQEKLRWEVKEKKFNVYSRAKADGAISDMEERALLIADDIINRDILENLNLPVSEGEPANLGQNDDDALEKEGDDGMEAEVEEEEDEEGAKLYTIKMPLPPVFKSVTDAKQFLGLKVDHAPEIIHA